MHEERYEGTLEGFRYDKSKGDLVLRILEDTSNESVEVKAIASPIFFECFILRPFEKGYNGKIVAVLQVGANFSRYKNVQRK